MKFASSSEDLNAIALQILNGLDPRKIRRWTDKPDAGLKYDEAIEKRELDWLKNKKIE